MRIIGSFNKANEFHLLIDDNIEDTDADILNGKGSMVIVEPHILIPTT